MDASGLRKYSFVRLPESILAEYFVNVMAILIFQQFLLLYVPRNTVGPSTFESFTRCDLPFHRDFARRWDALCYGGYIFFLIHLFPFPISRILRIACRATPCLMRQAKSMKFVDRNDRVLCTTSLKIYTYGISDATCNSVTSYSRFL